jgi:hypothetical protein
LNLNSCDVTPTRSPSLRLNRARTRAWSWGPCGGSASPSHFLLALHPSSPFWRPTRAHEESASYIEGSEWERPTTTPASTCSDAALTRTVAFRSAFPTLPARARADPMTFRNLSRRIEERPPGFRIGCHSERQGPLVVWSDRAAGSRREDPERRMASARRL